MSGSRPGSKGRRNSTLRASVHALTRMRADIRRNSKQLASREVAGTPLGILAECDPDWRGDPEVRDAYRWWLEQLPICGAELALELRAPENVLLEVFRRGVFQPCAPRQKLQPEGEEVAFYTIVLSGRLRLRCRGPTSKGDKNGTTASLSMTQVSMSAGDDTDAQEESSEGLVLCGEAGRGESPHLCPGEARSMYEVTCTERSLVLQLGPDDYAATLRPFHRRLNEAAVSFLKEYKLCPMATTYQLQRLALLLRHRRLRRGRYVFKVGDNQRTVWFLREGLVSIHLPKGVAPESLAQDAVEDGSSEDDADMDEEMQRFQRMKDVGARGQEAQTKGAADEEFRQKLAPHARGAVRRRLAAPLGDRTAGAQTGGLTVATAMLAEPTLLGEEPLLLDSLKDLGASKRAYAAKAEQDSLFYVADVAAFRMLSQLVGQEHLAAQAHSKLQGRCNRVGRGVAAEHKFARQARQLTSAEVARLERQRLRLPPCVGYKGAEYLDDVEDYLTTVMGHRKRPPQCAPYFDPGMVCLDTGSGPVDPRHGPGVDAALQIFNDPSMLRRHREELRLGGSAALRWSTKKPGHNPLGQTAPAGSRYLELAPPGKLSASASAPSLCTADVTRPGVFFNTEVDAEFSAPQGDSIDVLLRSAPAALTPREVLAPSVEASGSLPAPAASPSATSTGTSVVEARKAAEAERTRRVSRALKRALQGKTVLVLTEKSAVRKDLGRALLALDADLYYVRSTTEMWHRLADKKEHFHCLLLDLSKSELPTEPLLTALRANDRYGEIPVVALAEDRGLSETVQRLCSFVVFLPLSVGMLRESLLWCLDRRTVQGYFQDASSAVGLASNTNLQATGTGRGADLLVSAQAVAC